MHFKRVDANKVEGFCLVKTATRKTSVKGSAYMDFMLIDNDGEISAKLWDYAPALHGDYKGGEIVKVRGALDSYNGSPQLKIERIRIASDSDNPDYEEIVPCAPYQGKWMLEQINAVVGGFKDAELKLVTQKMLEQAGESLLYYPAALRLHHAMRGGLLYHTLTVLRLAEQVCKVYPFLNRELLLCGVILHDLAKVEELTASEFGVASDYSAMGNLIGHLVRGAMRVKSVCDKHAISDHTAMLLEHMLISHHSEPDYGSPVRPMFLEAEMLSMLDDMDAVMYSMSKACEPVAQGGFSERVWSLDNRKVYRTTKNFAGYSSKL